MLRSSLRRARVRLGAGALVAGCAAALTGCGGSSSGGVVQAFASPTAADGLHGVDIGAPVAKPDIRLTDTAGKPYDLRQATGGRLTLLYFGYTHCPDVCPTTMADLAQALRQVSPAVRAKTTVVFVTSDPARDTPAVIRRWLDNFDTSFVGLTGPIATIDKDATAVGVPLEPPEREANGTITVDHGAEVLPFTPADGSARIAYTADTSPADYAHDLPLLLAGRS